MMCTKLIFRNVRRSARDYLIYLVTLSICVTLFYAFLSISSRYYQPELGTEYDLTMLSDGMKLAICTVALLLLFLIRYVNGYMLQHRQKEFAVQAVMGMEQRTIGLLFFAETFVMGLLSIGIGIFLGVFCSQFITAMLLTSYGHDYRLSWTLFPDTVLLTLCFFCLSFLVTGFFNLRTIRRTKIITMLYADRHNEQPLKSSRWMSTIFIIYGLFLIFMLVTGINKMRFFYDARFAAPVKLMFWGNILAPAAGLLWPLLWLSLRLLRQKPGSARLLLTGEILLSVLNACFAAIVPKLQINYYLTLDSGSLNQYLMFLLVDLIFLICGSIYMANSLLLLWKAASPEHRYHGENLFFFGQLHSKLRSTNKTMTLICLTLSLSMVLFLAVPALTGWASGYLKIRSIYDIQISSTYNLVYEEAQLPSDSYEPVTDFLAAHHIETSADCSFSLYLPRREDFRSRVKWEFPVVAISLSDYNTLRQMLGYPPVSLKENEFSTQWQSIATSEELTAFLETHPTVETDAGTLTLAENACYEEPIGETVYNLYTDVLYIFPDEVCEKLLSVMRNRYIKTARPLPYAEARMLEQAFGSLYTEAPENHTGPYYYIRLRTLQVNGHLASNFILQVSMTYGAVVLMVICLTILSLQQLSDASHYRYRFGLLRKLGVEEANIRRLILKQLSVWFGLPVLAAGFVSAVLTIYFFQTISSQISAYIGLEALLVQVALVVGILGLLLLCYFISTWILFRRAVAD